MLSADDLFYASGLIFLALIMVIWLARPARPGAMRRGWRAGRCALIRAVLRRGCRYNICDRTSGDSTWPDHCHRARRAGSSSGAGLRCCVVAGYAAFGFYGVPALIRSQGSAFVTNKYQRTLQLGEIHFNPFTLELDIRNFAFPDADGKPMVGGAAPVREPAAGEPVEPRRDIQGYSTASIRRSTPSCVPMARSILPTWRSPLPMNHPRLPPHPFGCS